MPSPATRFLALPEELRGYRIRGLLGAGAMGAVYRATVVGRRRGLRSGDEVALKVLDPSFAPDAQIVRRFKREAGVGLGAGHAGIARVYEIGSLRLGGDRRVHYIVQELLTGGSLQSRLELEGPQPEPVVREVGRQVAETLAFVHGRNIVHRDLKPANLFLDERGQVKLVDFGLARLITAEEPLPPEAGAHPTPPPSSGATSSGRFLGTVAYAAPEQLAGAPATPQSDLFALGVVLYEMAAGHHPWARERDLGYDAYVAALQTRDPTPLTELRPELSYFLERIVQALLERDPAARLASAEQAAAAFVGAERSDFWRTATAPVSLQVSAGRRRLAVRRATRLLGRQHELALLVDEARAAFAGSLRRVVLEGEPGVGKTRLVDALADRLERVGPQGFFLVASGRESGQPLEPLRELLADACGLSEAAAAGPAAVDARAEQQLRELLPERPEAQQLLRAFLREGAGKAARQLAPLRAALVELFVAITRQAPLLLVLDAAEHADGETLRTLDALVAEAQRAPILLVITRAHELPTERTLAALHASLAKGSMRLALVDPPREAFTTLAHDLGFDEAHVERVAARLHEVAAGSAGNAVELASWLRSRGKLDTLAAKKTAIRSLPPLLAERYAQRLARLGSVERELLETTAVLGADVREQVLRDMLALPAAEFDLRLAPLLAEGGPLQRIAGELRFREPLFQRHVLHATALERRQQTHRLAARYYQRELAQPSPPPRAALKAAWHADLGGERTILAATLRGATRVLELEGSPERAWRLVASAVAAARVAPPDERLLAQALVLRGGLAHRLGRREEERATWTEAAKLSAQLDDAGVRSHAFHGLGRLASRTGRFLAAESYLRTADEAAQRSARGQGAERAFILLDLAEVLLWSGDEERAAQALEQAEQVIDAGAPVASIGRYFKERGNLLLELERFDEAEQAFSQGRSIVRGPALRPLHRALVLGSARLLRELCDWDKARRACEVARKSAASDLDLRHLAQAEYVRADIEARSGDPDAAFKPYVRSLRLALRVDDGYLAVSALGSLSLLYRWERFSGHSIDRAIRCARRAIARAHSLAVGRLEARGLAALALCYRDMKRGSWALAIARKALREGSAAGIERRRAAEIYWVHGLIAGELGHSEAAAKSLEEARRRTERRLLGVASPAVRTRMSERDPLLRAIHGEERRR
ncbi:MAG: protein kinase [Planctomycetes bacterium]|nr:protein kinase [Planctomycetota bacterium]